MESEIETREIFIKEEPLDQQFYGNVLQNIKKEECITNNDIGNEYENPITINEDIRKKINYQKFEEVYIKEENPQDGEFYGNVLQSIKKEECVTNNDIQINKVYNNPITINNDIQKTIKNCCTICNKSFSGKCTLTRHMKIHSGKKEYFCHICNKYFQQNSALQVHLKVHNEIKEYECSFCKKLFVRKCHLNEHMKIHSGIRDYKCTICNKLFTQNSSLYKHMKSHTETRAYKCPTCNKLFKHSSNLKDHMTSHSGIKDYKCTICNKLFTRSSSLTKHMKTHSGTKE